MITYRKGRTVEYGQTVRVYKNLNKDCFSIMDNKTKLVIGYADQVTLKDVRFVVKSSGQARAREQQRRNVHAFVVGRFVSTDKKKPPGVDREAHYNPFYTDFFIDPTTESSLHAARIAHLEDGKCYVL